MKPVRPEYPRPHFDRSHSWLSLNGAWDFSPDPEGRATADRLRHDDQAWSERITVPFAWETTASGIGRHWLEYGWYRRNIAVPEGWQGQRIVLHFGAVHHAATVWVDDTQVGAHEGGYTPFELDITDALTDGAGTVLVRVWAPADKREMVHGKQRSIPRDDYDVCAFTPSSGIWQPVWLEARPATHVSELNLAPGTALDGLSASITVAGPSVDGARLEVAVDGGEPVTVHLDGSGAAVDVPLPLAQPRLWSPEDPFLYRVAVTLHSADGIDRVASQTGLRRIETDGEQLLLNGRRLYLRGVLDQGYWPHTGLTAPDDSAFAQDLELARDAGFNLVRKHLKLEDPRFLHHADRLGMLVWAEPASTGICTPASIARFEEQIAPMVRRDGNHPCVVIWGLYNEEWGLDWDLPGDPAKQDAVRRAYTRLKALDPSRPIVDNSGWAHVATDLVDWHIYDETPGGWAAKVQALLAEEKPSFPVGLGPDLVVDKLLMADGGSARGLPNLNSEFGGGATPVERGWNLRWQTLQLRCHEALSGYVWTELYDVEHEMAGIYTFDRSAKDNGGNPPQYVNAETVLLVELEPHAPGRDLVTGPERKVDVSVRVSHHGERAEEVIVVPVWGPLLGACDEASAVSAGEARAGAGEPVTVQPFRISEPVRVVEQLPDSAPAARLHLLALAVGSGTVLARTWIDAAVQPGADAAERTGR